MRPPMRLLSLASAVLCAAGLAACSSTSDGPGGSGLSRSFEMTNYRRSNDTNGTQTRPDVNRSYTQPVLPTVVGRGN